MTNGGIEANGPGRSVAISAASGSPVLFLTTIVPPQRAPAQIFCIVVCNPFDVLKTFLTVSFSSQVMLYQATTLQVPSIFYSCSVKPTSVVFSILILRFMGTMTGGFSVQRCTDPV